MKTRPRHLAGVILLAGVLAAAPACGRKTPLLIPDSPRPAAVNGLAAAVRDNSAYLSWEVPALNVEGRPLAPGQIARFTVYRAEVTPERKKRRFREIADIGMDAPAPAEVRQGKVFWSDRDLQYGRIYAYRVRVESVRGGVSAFSPEVIAAPLMTVSRPGNPKAAAADGLVNLTWAAVTSRADGSRHDGFVGYNIYRGTAPGRYGPRPVNSEPLRTTSYRDTAVENGKTYYYMLRAVDSPVPPWRESADSEETAATPTDQTAPKAPSGLTAVPGIGRVFLTWNENNEADVNGYHVYRAEKGGKYGRLTAEPIKRTTYSDETPRAGAAYLYAVTAIDRAGNESPRSREEQATAERRR